MRVVELIDFPEGASTERGPARGHRLIICCGNGHVVCFDLTQQRLVRDVTVTP